MSYAFGFSSGLRLIAVLITLLSLSQVVLTLAPSHEGSAKGQEDDGMDSSRGWSEAVPHFDVYFMIDSDQNTYSQYFGQKWAKLSPGAEGIYWIIIYNSGPLNDTFHIELSAPSRDAGWDWYFMDNGKLYFEVELISPQTRDKLGGITYKTVPIMVQSPIDATRDPRVSITVTAVSEKDLFDPGIVAPVDSDMMFFVPRYSGDYDVRIWDRTMFFVDPGEWITLPVSLSNLGNKDFINVSLTIDENEFWHTTYRDFESIYQRKHHILDYEWTETTVTIKQGQSIRMDVKVRIPPEFFGWDDVMQFRLLARIEGTNYWMISEIVTLIVERYTELSAGIFGGDTFPVEPGQVTRVHLDIFNTYDNADVLEEVYLLYPKGVQMEALNATNGEFEKTEIPGYLTTIVPLEFYLNETYPPGPTDLKMVIKTRYFGNLLLNITLDVQEKDLMRLLPTDPLIKEVVDMSPGKEGTLVFGVRNEGNCNTKVTLELVKKIMAEGIAYPLPLDNGWSYRVDWISQIREPANFIKLGPDDIPVRTGEFYRDIGYTFPQALKGFDTPFWVEPDETVWVSLKVKCPGGSGVEMVPHYPVTAMLFTAGGGALDMYDVVLEPRYPDLVFDEFMVLTNDNGDQVMDLKEGDKVFFIVNITNIGQGFSDRAKVSVFADDDHIKELWIIPLAPGEKALLVGNITISRGMESIVLVLDPENGVPEMDDQYMEGSTKDANIERAALFVEWNEEKGNGILTAVYVILALLIAASIPGGFILYFRMKKIKGFKIIGR